MVGGGYLDARGDEEDERRRKVGGGGGTLYMNWRRSPRVVRLLVAGGGWSSHPLAAGVQPPRLPSGPRNIV